MSDGTNPNPGRHEVPAWKFFVILAVVLAGVSLGTLLIIPRAERGRTRPAKAVPAPFIPRATNQIVIPDSGTPPPR